MHEHYTVRVGDTLPMIAQRELGDADRWSEIVELNNLVYPYISTERSNGVVGFGDSLLIPLSEEDIESSIIDLGLQDSDLLLDYNKFAISYSNDGELVPDGLGDLKTVSGLDCLMQDLVNRLATPTGTLPYHPDYGSDINEIIGNKMDTDWVEKARIEVMRTFSSDDRVVSVDNVVVTADRGIVRIHCDITTVDGLRNVQIII